MDGPGRPKKFKIDVAYRLLRRSNPPVWTAADIGDELGVAGSTVRENIDELLEYPGVSSHELGRTTVYYYDHDQASDDLGTTDPQSDGIELTPEESAAEARGRWEWAVRRARERRSEAPLSSRAGLYEQLVKCVRVLDDTTVSIDYSVLVTDTETPRNNPEAPKLPPIRAEEWPLSHDEIEYYLTEIGLLSTAGVGEVEGFARLAADPVAEPLSNEYGATYVEDAAREELDQELPSLGDVMEAGELWNDFMSQMMGWRW